MAHLRRPEWQAVVTERTARRLSPVVYVVILLCFLLPFASANSSTAKAKDAAHQLLGVGASPSLVAGLTACLDALNGRTIATYSGVTLARGADPSASPQRVDACASSHAAPTLSAQGGNIGAEGLVVAALVLTALGALFGAAPFQGRGLVVAILSGIAMVLLFLSENHLQPTIADRLSPVPDLVSVDAGAGYWLVLVLLGLAALYNSAATITDGSGR